MVSVKSQLAQSLVAVEVYPNPSIGGLVNLKFPELATLATKIEVIDATGKFVQSVNVPANTTLLQLNRSELQSGIYHIFWVNGNKKYRPATLVIQ